MLGVNSGLTSVASLFHVLLISYVFVVSCCECETVGPRAGVLRAGASMLRIAAPLFALAPPPPLPTVLRCGTGAAAVLGGGKFSRRFAVTAVVAFQQRPQSSWAWPFGPSRAPADVPEPTNIFLRILNGEAPASVVDNEDPDLFTFRDRRPASDVHLLIIPRRFVRDAAMLRGSDATLVRSMEAKAIALVRAEIGDEAFDEAELALGFHWPPWYSVPWLHLHAIYPKSRITRWYKYTPFSFKSPAWVLRRLSRYTS